MSIIRNLLALFVCVLVITSCNKDDFPELRAENEGTENIETVAVYEATGETIIAKEEIGEGKVIVASVAPTPQKDEKAMLAKAIKEIPEKDGVVIVASAAKDDASVVKTKPILKEKTRKNLIEPKDNIIAEKKKPTGNILAPKEMKKINTVDDSVTEVVVEDEVIFAEPVYNTIQEDISEPSVTYQVDTFYFDNGSANVKNEYKKRIKEIAKTAKEKNAYVYVLGFSSSRTKNTDYVTHKMINFKTSLARAENVAEEFIKAGVKSERVMLEALSDGRPAYLEVMPEGERLNRRVEVYIGY